MRFFTTPQNLLPAPRHGRSLQAAIAFKTPRLLHQRMQTSNERITGRRGDAAVVLPVLGHVDVAFVAPVFTPAERKRHEEQTVRCVQLETVTAAKGGGGKCSPVLHDPKLLSIRVLFFVAVSHDQNAVVQLLAAALLLKIDS